MAAAGALPLAALLPLGPRAIGAFAGQTEGKTGASFKVVGSRSPGTAGTSGRPRATGTVTSFRVAPAYFLAALAGGAGATGAGRAGIGGTTLAALSPGDTLLGVSPAPPATLPPGFPGGGPGGRPGTGFSTGSGDGVEAGPDLDQNSDPNPDSGPAPVPLPLPGLLLACTLCGLSPVLRRRR
ncbi:MAG: hypothetical protein JNK88_05590 [Mangrovicoccus sp.]|nr:hypothetical protein [Mangrovicoccus sp.]